MIEYNKCKLYGLTTKRQLAKYLSKISVSKIKKHEFFLHRIKPAVVDGKRLIEAPTRLLKDMQKIILNDFKNLDIPQNVFSGIKKRSYIMNVSQHVGKNHFMKIDLSKFFPHIKRDRVYRFYKNKFNLPNDLAEILTNLSTINIEQIDTEKFSTKQLEDYANAKDFMVNKKIKVKDHLITGSRISPILSYLVNEEMFNEIQNYCDSNQITFTIYVDDMAFSSKKKITQNHKHQIYGIINRFGYPINKSKTKIIDINDWKHITGGEIDKHGNLKCPKKLELKLRTYNDEFKKGDFTNIDKLRGLIVAMYQIEPKKYEFLYNVIMRKYSKLKQRKNQEQS